MPTEIEISKGVSKLLQGHFGAEASRLAGAISYAVKLLFPVYVASSGLNVKSGTVEASGTQGTVTFATPFNDAPRVVMSAYSTTQALGNCRYRIDNVSSTGFSYTVQKAGYYMWIATDIGDV